ncbi:hypothetical protein CRENPOLYSF2_4200002 [Crenothrix polyspora]|uniref:Uncharacterized protein n=1 Tax=Crenothrix polyspora TaxID=360316 RepID=A0A1R4HEV2_9GAMM|nr:hypothetical protein CRENPOLYSF2_4200002 [Crenothrix polyspora]
MIINDFKLKQLSFRSVLQKTRKNVGILSQKEVLPKTFCVFCVFCVFRGLCCNIH